MSKRALLIGLALAEITCAMAAIIVVISNVEIITFIVLIAGFILMCTLRYL